MRPDPGALRRRLAVRRPLWLRWFTPVAGAAAILGLAAWVAAAWFDWEELAYVAGAVVVALVVAAVFTVGRTQLRVELRLEPSRVVVGERAVAALDVTNASSSRLLPLRLEVPVGRGLAQVDVPSLPAGETHDDVIVIPTARRSVIPLGPVRSVRGDPLGLFRREQVWTGVEELFVHPVTARLTGLSSGWLRDLEGSSTQELSNSDINFHALREYVPGDDRRHVHWRTSARLNKLMVRQFVDTRRSHLALLLSTFEGDYADPDELELAVSMVGSLGLRALADGQTASFLAGARELPVPTGQKLLDGCSRVELGDSTRSVGELAVAGHGLAMQASVVVVATGSAATVPQLRAATERFAHQARTICLRAAPDEAAAFRPVGPITVVDAPTLDDFGRLMWTLLR